MSSQIYENQGMYKGKRSKLGPLWLEKLKQKPQATHWVHCGQVISMCF